MAGSSFWDSVYDAMPSTRDIGSWLGYGDPYASPMYGVERTQTGIRPTDTSYGFLDLAGDIGGSVWDAGKKAISWGGRAIESDTFKNIMNNSLAKSRTFIFNFQYKIYIFFTYFNFYFTFPHFFNFRPIYIRCICFKS